jgi:hypothetical protein
MKEKVTGFALALTAFRCACPGPDDREYVCASSDECAVNFVCFQRICVTPDEVTDAGTAGGGSGGGFPESTAGGGLAGGQAEGSTGGGAHGGGSAGGHAGRASAGGGAGGTSNGGGVAGGHAGGASAAGGSGTDASQGCDVGPSCIGYSSTSSPLTLIDACGASGHSTMLANTDEGLTRSTCCTTR